MKYTLLFSLCLSLATLTPLFDKKLNAQANEYSSVRENDQFDEINEYADDKSYEEASVDQDADDDFDEDEADFSDETYDQAHHDFLTQLSKNIEKCKTEPMVSYLVWDHEEGQGSIVKIDELDLKTAQYEKDMIVDEHSDLLRHLPHFEKIKTFRNYAGFSTALFGTGVAASLFLFSKFIKTPRITSSLTSSIGNQPTFSKSIAACSTLTNAILLTLLATPGVILSYNITKYLNENNYYDLHDKIDYYRKIINALDERIKTLSA